VDPRGGLDDVEKRKLLPLPRLELRPAASRYADCATAACYVHCTCNRPSEQLFTRTLLRNVEMNPRPGGASDRVPKFHCDSLVWHSERMRDDTASNSPGCTASHGSVNLQACGRGGHAVIEVLSRNFLGETEEYHETPQSGQLVSRQRCQPSTSRMQDWSVTAALTCLVKFCNVRSRDYPQVCFDSSSAFCVCFLYLPVYGVCFCYSL
jgi:hypothetical protein